MIKFDSWKNIDVEFIKCLPKSVNQIYVFDDDVIVFRAEKEDDKWEANIIHGNLRNFTPQRLYPSSLYKYIMSACKYIENKGLKPFVEFYNSTKEEDYAYTLKGKRINYSVSKKYRKGATRKSVVTRKIKRR